MSYAAALADIFITMNTHAHCSLYWFNPTHAVLLETL